MSSRERKVSVFTPPPDHSAEESASYLAPGPSQGRRKVVTRKFSHEEAVTPIPINTTADDLSFIDVLSSSTLADVLRVRRKDTKQIIAAKAFNRSSWRSEYLCHAELRVLHEVNSPWIVNFYGFIQDFNEDFLLFEYLPNGSLLDLIRNHSLSESQIRFYAAEMLLATDSLHQFGIMHRNVMLSNFLIHTSGHLRLIGFGVSYQFEDKGKLIPDDHRVEQESSKANRYLFRRKAKLSRITNPVFASPDKAIPISSRMESRPVSANTADGETSIGYMAPEVLRLVMPKPLFQMGKNRAGYSYLCDFWSLGVAIYRMLYGTYPFKADCKGLILDKVLKHKKTLVFPFGSVTVEASSLVKGLLKKESSRLGRQRGFFEIRNHSFFRELEFSHLGHGKVAVPVRNSDLVRYMATGPSTSADSHSSSKDGKSVGPSGGEEDNISRSSSSSGDLDNEKQLSTLDVDFPLPLCSDPTVSAIDWTAHHFSVTQLERKAGSSGSRTSLAVSRPRKSSKQAEITYLQKLMLWFGQAHCSQESIGSILND